MFKLENYTRSVSGRTVALNLTNRHVFKDLCSRYINDVQVQITPSLPDVDLNVLGKYDLIVLGGGSLLLPGYLAILERANAMGKKIIIWGTGLDWIGKEQLEKLLENKETSFQENFKDKDIEVLKNVVGKASFIGVRGPLTKQVIDQLLVNDCNNVEVIGDPGLLLKNSSIMKKEKIIGINWGTTYNRLYGGNEEFVENELAEVGKKLIQLGYKIIIYSVWNNDQAACERLYRKINNKESVTLMTTLYDEKRLISLLSGCEWTINFKLHANLLSYAAGTPAIPLGYRFKVFDFGSLLDLEHYIVSTDSKKLQSDILQRVHLVESKRDQINKKYHLKQEFYIPKLEEPFKNNLYL